MFENSCKARGISEAKSFTAQCRLFNEKRSLLKKKNVGKLENASDQYFLLFPQGFLPYQRQITSFELH